MNYRSLIVLISLMFFLEGCAVAAAPCRITGVVAKLIPVIGDPIGEALDSCGDAID